MADSIPSYTDPPFAVEPDIELDLPLPPSVNGTRKIDWKNHAQFKDWQKDADNHVLAAKCRTSNSIRNRSIKGRFEMLIVLGEDTRSDMDNTIKHTVDFCKRAALITDDSPKYFRKLTVQFGNAPHGCKIILRPWEGK